jgi:hypothetical protein
MSFYTKSVDYVVIRPIICEVAHSHTDTHTHTHKYTHI